MHLKNTGIIASLLLAFSSSAFAAVPSLSIEDQIITEGQSNTKPLAFKLTLSEISSSDVTVNYATANGSATAGSDYVATPTTSLTIPAGQLSKAVSVTINGDTTSEADETFLVNLSTPSGATIADGQGIGTILNDDSAGFVVNNTTDNNDGVCTAVGTGNGCSLREATNAANSTVGLNTISFAPNVTGTIALKNGELVLHDSTTILGPGAGVLAVSGNSASRIFSINSPNNVQVSIYALGFIRGTGSGASTAGGAIRVDGANNQLALTECTFNQNSSSGNGGALFNNGTLNVNRCTFIKNSGILGGAISNENSLTINKSVFNGNSSNGGGAIDSGKTGDTGTVNAIISDSSFSQNTVAALGGGAIFAHNRSSITVLDGSFSENKATGLLGGAILLGIDENDSFNSSIQRCSFATNASRYGSAIHNYHGVSNIINCVFDANTATYVGTIYNHGNVNTVIDDSDTVFISNCTFRSNNATTSGGAVHNDYRRKGIVNSCNFIKNRASAGSAIMNAGSLTVVDNTFSENKSDSGTIYINDSPYPGTAQVANCKFDKNTATNNGAGIYNGLFANVNVSNSTFSSNQANNGSAIVNLGTSITDSCTFSGNKATNGGTFYNYESNHVHSASIINSTFNKNTAVNGGAIINGINAVLEVESSTFADNIASTTGHSIYNYSYGTTTVKNSIFKIGATGVNFVNNQFGSFTSNGYNLSSDNGQTFLTGPGDKINTNPQLGVLQNNGGPTLTMLPNTGSPAIDAGNTDLTVDQRGIVRPQGVADDIGAVEVFNAVSPPVITVTSTPASESAGLLTFTFTLSKTSTQPIQVLVENASASSFPATLGEDFEALPSGGKVLTFAPGDTEKTLTITLINDNLDEEDEKVALRWSATGVTPESGTIESAITNDDSRPSVGISILDASVTEGNAGQSVLMEFEVRLSKPSGRVLTGTYSTMANGTTPATAGTDYIAVTGASIVFQPREVVKTIQIRVNGDNIREGDEKFRVQIKGFANTVISRGAAVGTIIDDDSSAARSVGSTNVS